MITISAFSIFVVCTALIQVESLEASGNCSEGQGIRNGFLLYICQGGRFVPAACITGSGRRVEIGDTFNYYYLKVQCVQDVENGVRLKVLACIDPYGEPVPPNQVFYSQFGMSRCIEKPDGQFTIERVEH